MTATTAEWLLYFNTTYVGNLNSRTGRRKQPKFCHTSWNKYNEVLDSESTTSNKAEAWNKAYGVRSDPNTSFWGALDSFRREEALAVRKFREETINVRSQAAAATEQVTHVFCSSCMLQTKRRNRQQGARGVHAEKLKMVGADCVLECVGLC